MSVAETLPRRPGRVPRGDIRLARRLKEAMKGEVLFDAFSRGRYATDASFYQVEPIGVVVPRDEEDVSAILSLARDEGLPVLPRGGGTSQCGQTVGEALVIDYSKHLNGVVSVDAENRSATVQPGVVLDDLNRTLKSTGLWFPVDVSTASRATIGGMAGNNSCGSRSLRYGIMRDNVSAIDAVLPDGTPMRFGEVDPAAIARNAPSKERDLAADLLGIGRANAAELAERLPNVLRRVGGYNLDALLPGTDRPSGERWRPPGAPPNLAHLLIGSEGTLATFNRIHLKLSPIPKHKALGVCHFPTFYKAMDSAQHLVTLAPVAIELVDRTMIELSRQIPMFRETTDRFVMGDPDALLIVEFAEETDEENRRKLKLLGEMMGDLGLPGAVVEATDSAFQAAIWGVRTEGLNIMMSMKSAGKPVSFVEDTAVPLEHLADYTSRLDEVFVRHGSKGTWYAHASEGCLHVRPVLNLKLEADVRKMRAIAEEAFAMVREYKGSHSGEHGDGLVRAEFHRDMFGDKLVAAFGEVKRRFDPENRHNPGKIVDPSRMDDRSLFRFKPDYRAAPMETALDWSDWGGLGGAVEMCNNNGACRKATPGVMCPSYRVTRNERDLTRGRANTLRLALSGQLGPDAFASDDMAETMKLCVSCKGCRRECPTGVDMARMKIEVLARRVKERGLSLSDRLVAYLPRYAPLVSRLPFLANARDRIPGLAALSERLAGFSAKRSLPVWAKRPFAPAMESFGPEGGREVVLLADTFNRYFEPENLEAALEVLVAAGCRVHLPKPADGASRPLCCGRTFLAAGLVDEAKAEAKRVRDTLAPHVARGAAIVGLEPSCLLSLRDEFLAMAPGAESEALAERAFLLEEFLERELAAGRLSLPLKALPQSKAYLHGHCHQKAFQAAKPVENLLRRIPGLEVTAIESSCCGMAGAFGYRADTYETSMKMGELSLLPAVRQAPPDALVVADGTSCRHQIHDGAERRALHAAVVLRDALERPHV